MELSELADEALPLHKTCLVYMFDVLVFTT